MNVVGYFRANVRRQPSALAVRSPQGDTSYEELDRRSDGLCRGLEVLGVGTGDRVCIMMTNRLEFVELAIGIAKAGAALVPLSVMDGPKQVDHILSDCKPAAVIYEDAFRQTVGGPASRHGITRIVLCDGPSQSEERSYESVALDGAPVGAVGRGGDVLYVGYTSGSTGSPKGVVKDHQSVVSLGLAVAAEWGLRPGDTQLVTMPMCHSGGYWQMLFNLILGGTVGIKSTMSFDPDEVLDLIAKWSANWIVLVPTMSDTLIAVARGRDHDLGSLRVVVSGSAPMFTSTKEGLLKLFPGARLNECYGATETGVVTNLGHEDQLRKTRCVGKPILGVEAMVVDGNGTPQPPGEVGELVARSSYAFREYHGRPEITAAAIRDGGFVGVGDLAVQDDEGYFYIIDRKQDMIITGGLNVYPAEVEEVLKQHPGVADAVVVGLQDSRWGERVTAAVVAENELDLDALSAECGQHLPRYKVPKEIRLLDELPRLVSGKNSRRLVREVLQQDDELSQ